MLYKKLENIKYKILYRNTTTYNNYDIFDVLIIYLNDIGIKYVSNTSEYYTTIVFNDGTVFKFWNQNKYYAWMSYGDIHFSNGEELKWDRKSPSYKVLYLFKKALNNYKNNDNDNNNVFENRDYSKYLPLKYLRREKIKRLK